jgi:iron complex transport system substrate-binding protein
MGKRNVLLALGLAVVGFLLAGLINVISDQRITPRASQAGSIAKTPRRIAVVTPSICEIVFYLGYGDQVVAVSDFCTYPPETRTRENVGGWINPNRERILTLHPDIIMTQGKHEIIANLCREQEIDFFTLEIETLPDIRAAMLAVGERLGANERTAEAVRDWDAALTRIRERVENYSRPSVFLTFSRQPGRLSGLMTPGAGAFLSDIIDLAGGRNVFSDAKGNWPTISKEALVMRGTEVILELSPEELTEEQRAALRADWNKLPSLPAVKTDRIYYLTGDYLLLPGPRVTQTAEAFARVLHPEAFRE